MGDQEAFALLSGDYNPLHIDPVLARRTLLGGVVVHGVNLAMTAIESLLASLPGKVGEPRLITAISAQFPKAVFVGEKVRFKETWQAPDNCRITGHVEDTTVFRTDIQFGARLADLAEIAIPTAFPELLTEAGFDELLTFA
jgi:acyl dehydratase